MRQTLAVLLLVVLVACKTEATKQAKARDELASWAETGALLSTSWARGSAHTPYAKSTVKVASDALEKLTQDLPDDKTVVEAQKLYEKLSQAIEEKDRSAAQPLARDFAELGKRVKPSS